MNASKTQLLHVERGIQIEKWIIHVTCQADNEIRFHLFLQMLTFLQLFYMTSKKSLLHDISLILNILHWPKFGRVINYIIVYGIS